MMRLALICLSMLLLQACHERVGLAPVSEAHIQRETMPAIYRVQRHDTLYSIAFRYDQDYRAIAQLNGFSPPYVLYVGQLVYLKYPQIHTHQTRMSPLPIAMTKKKYTHVVTQTSRLRWPTQQKQIRASFSPEHGRKGIDISGYMGGFVYASAPGVVAYAGDGLSGYGHLVIIKHNDKLLTAYGHNARLFVKEGQRVYAGQKIATMGRLDRSHAGLHYEVREWGKPVDPIRYLSH